MVDKIMAELFVRSSAFRRFFERAPVGSVKDRLKAELQTNSSKRGADIVCRSVLTCASG